MDRDQLKHHLEFAAELGVAGMSRDGIWRRRPGDSESVPSEPAQPLTFV